MKNSELREENEGLREENAKLSEKLLAMHKRLHKYHLKSVFARVGLAITNEAVATEWMGDVD